jgi:hypothetical protein
MIINNSSRNGNFTSSEIVALLSLGKRDMTELEIAEHKKLNPKSRKVTIESWPGEAALTYIEECNMERRLNRSITNEISARATAWGSLLETPAHEHLGFEYELCSQETLDHPTIECWKGSPDLRKYLADGTVDTAGDIKCPMTLKSFCKLVDPFYSGLRGMDAMNAIRFGYTDKDGVEHTKHNEANKYYWQIVSNAVLTGAKYGELVVYVPYQSELDAIRALSDGNAKYYWIWGSHDEELPFLPDGGFYKNINTIRFEIPQEDKDRLTRHVQMGSKLLISPDSQKN